MFDVGTSQCFYEESASAQLSDHAARTGLTETWYRDVFIFLVPTWYRSTGSFDNTRTHVNLVLSSLLRIDWSVNPSLCLLNDDSGLCISSMQKRMLFAGFTAAKKTIIQNWFTPHMCRKTYWIRSLLQIVTCECATARIGGARPSTIDAWQCFLLDIRDCIKE